MGGRKGFGSQAEGKEEDGQNGRHEMGEGIAFSLSSCRGTNREPTVGTIKAPTPRKKQQFGQRLGYQGAGLLPSRGQLQGPRPPCDCPMSGLG